MHPEDASPLAREHLRYRPVGEDHQLLYKLPRLGRAPRRRPYRNAVLVQLVLGLPSAELQLAPDGRPRLQAP